MSAARRARMRHQCELTANALQSNSCPVCASGVKRNYALTGWVQCEQFGAPMFRKRPELPPCNWQGFLEVSP